MSVSSLDNYIRNVENFPREGVNFKDITSILLQPEICNFVIDSFIEKIDGVSIDLVVGIESRGFLFGMLLANRMGLPFVPIRKSGKLPLDTVKLKYELEYGFDEVEVHKNDIPIGSKVLLHDDLLATGGTAKAAATLINSLKSEIVCFAFVIILDSLKGSDHLKKYSSNIVSLINY